MLSDAGSLSVKYLLSSLVGGVLRKNYYSSVTQRLSPWSTDVAEGKCLILKATTIMNSEVSRFCRMVR